jgi:hypothetical protein
VLEASISDFGSQDTHTYTWDFGDGTKATDTLNPTHTYTQDGTYNPHFASVFILRKLVSAGCFTENRFFLKAV